MLLLILLHFCISTFLQSTYNRNILYEDLNKELETEYKIEVIHFFFYIKNSFVIGHL